MGIFSFSSKEDKEQLRAVNENYAIICFNTNMEILDANENFLNVLGYTKQEIMGKKHAMFCDPSLVRSNSYSKFWNDLRSGITQTSEFKRIRKDGVAIFIQASYIPIKDSSGNVYKVIKFAQDITERTTESLYYKGQVEAISKSQAVIEFDMSGKILWANDNFLNTLDYRLEEIVGKHHSMFCETSYKNSPEYGKFWDKLNDGLFDSGQYLRIGKNNKKVYIQASYNPIIGIDGKPFKVVKYASDVTEKQNMIYQINENVQKLTESLDGISSSSASVSQGSKSAMHNSQEATSSISHVNESVSHISEKIESMLQSINSIAVVSKKGMEISKNAQVQSQTTTEAMIKLDEASSKIGETINLITQIAFQTNILSLNAAVEAATAGEAGKGFAVVAQEVRNLAARSDQASKEITDVIALIQTLVKDSLASINDIANTITEMTAMSENISKSISDQQNISNEVSSITSKTSTEINEVTNTMIGVARMAEGGSKESQHNLDLTNNLIQVSNELIEILKKLS